MRSNVPGRLAAATSLALVPLVGSGPARAANLVSDIVGDYEAAFHDEEVAPLVARLSVVDQQGNRWYGTFCTGATEPTDCVDVTGRFGSGDQISASQPSSPPFLHGRMAPDGDRFRARVSFVSPREWFAETFHRVTPPVD